MTVDFLKKEKLRSELTALACEKPELDAALANEDMKDYLNLLDQSNRN